MPPKAEAFSISFGDGPMGGASGGKAKARPKPKKGQSFQFLKRDEGISALGKLAELQDGVGPDGKVQKPCGDKQKKSAAFRAAIQQMKKGNGQPANAFQDSMVAVPKAAPPPPAWTVREGEDPYGLAEQKPSRPPLQEKHSNALSPTTAPGRRRVTSPDKDPRKPGRSEEPGARRTSNSAATQSHACPSPSGRRERGPQRTSSTAGRAARKPHTASHPPPKKSLAQLERGFDLSIDKPLSPPRRDDDAHGQPAARRKDDAALRAREDGFVLDLVDRPPSPLSEDRDRDREEHEYTTHSARTRNPNPRGRYGTSPGRHHPRDEDSDGEQYRRNPPRRGRDDRHSRVDREDEEPPRGGRFRDRSREPEGAKRGGGYSSFSSRDGDRGVKESMSMSMSDDLDAYERERPRERGDRDRLPVKTHGSRSTMSDFSYDEDAPAVDPTILQHLEEKVAKEKDLLRRQERLYEAATEEAEAVRRTKASIRAVRADIQQLRMAHAQEEEEYEERVADLNKAIERAQGSNLQLERQVREEQDTIKMLQDEEELRWLEVDRKGRELEEQKYKSLREKERRTKEKERRRAEAAQREREARERQEQLRRQEQLEEQLGAMEGREAAGRDAVMHSQLEAGRALRRYEREGREQARAAEHERMEAEWEAQVAQQEREEEARRREEREQQERHHKERERQRERERQEREEREREARLREEEAQRALEAQRQREREEEARLEQERQRQLDRQQQIEREAQERERDRERQQREAAERERQQREAAERERQQREAAERERQQREAAERERQQREAAEAEAERQRQADIEAREQAEREAAEREREAARPPQHPKPKRAEPKPQTDANGQKLHYSVYMAEADEQEPLVNIANDPIIDRRENQDGKVELYYGSRKREVTYSNGTRKTVYPTGHIFLEFNNLDVRKTYPSGKVVYYYHQAETTHTTTKSGVQFFEFHSNGQTERHNPDASKIINFPDGTSKFIRADGVEQSLPSRASLSDDIQKWLKDSVHPQQFK